MRAKLPRRFSTRLSRRRSGAFPAIFCQTSEPLDTVELPEGKAKLYDRADFYDANALAIGKGKITLRHRAQAEVAKLYADLHRHRVH